MGLNTDFAVLGSPAINSAHRIPLRINLVTADSSPRLTISPKLSDFDF
jgi:hypothetical protein